MGNRTKTKKKPRKLGGAAAAAAAAPRTTTTTITTTTKGKTMAKSKGKKKSGGKKSKGKGAKKSGRRPFLTKGEAAAGAGVALAYGYLQGRAEKAKGDEMKWFKEAPTVTPLGRAGTVAAVAGGVAYFAGGTIGRIGKVVALGTGLVALANFGRRGFELYTEADSKSIMAGADEGSLYLAGSDDRESISGELDLVDEDAIAA